MNPDNKAKEMFVATQSTVDQILRVIRAEAKMRKETSDIYFMEEIRIYRMDEDAWFVGCYGPIDRRKK